MYERTVKIEGSLPCDLCTREVCEGDCCFYEHSTSLQCDNTTCILYESEYDSHCAWGLAGRCGANKEVDFDEL